MSIDISIEKNEEKNTLSRYFAPWAKYRIMPVKDDINLSVSVVQISKIDIMYTAHSSTGLVIDNFSSKDEKIIFFSNIFGQQSDLLIDGTLTPVALSGAIFELAELKRVIHGSEFLNRVFVLDKLALLTHLRALVAGPITDLRFEPTFARRSPTIRLLGQIASIMAQAECRGGGISQFPLASLALQEAIRTIVLEGFQHNYSTILHRPRSPALPRHVRRAIEYIRCNIDRPLSILDIAQDCGASVRALQTGFSRFLDMTPRGYIQSLRLEQAHLDLIDETNQESVTQIALKWGFTHLGRFAQIYRQRYGVSPSRTRRPRPPARMEFASNASIGAGFPKK